MSRFERVMSLLALAALVAGCQPRSRPASAAAASRRPDLEFRDVTLAEFDGAAKTWDLRAGAVAYDGAVATLRDVRVRYFEGGKVAVSCLAPHGAFDTRSHDLELAGPVDVDGGNRYASVQADRVWWGGRTRRLQADGHVVFRRGASRMVASGLEADGDLRRLRLAGPIDARFRLAHQDR